MYKYLDAVELFTGFVNKLRLGRLHPNSSLEEIVLKICKTQLAYVDNRREAKRKYKYDFWREIRKIMPEFENYVSSLGVNESILYSKSQQFPDFLFKVRKRYNQLICGSLLELKDSTSGSIASFNSTLPTWHKSLEEIDIVNGGNLVSKIAAIMDGGLSKRKDYYLFERKTLYLVRTFKDNSQKTKISIIEGSFFETLPKDKLIYQMFKNIIHHHLEQKDINISKDLLTKIEDSFVNFTDQSIIAASQTIENASIKPRLRIMAEVHPEGNPHSSAYPEVTEKNINLILKASENVNEIEKLIKIKNPEVNNFVIKHKRNGEHVVFQYKM